MHHIQYAGCPGLSGPAYRTQQTRRLDKHSRSWTRIDVKCLVFFSYNILTKAVPHVRHSLDVFVWEKVLLPIRSSNKQIFSVAGSYVDRTIVDCGGFFIFNGRHFSAEVIKNSRRSRHKLLDNLPQDVTNSATSSQLALSVE